jgi:excinuclease ABC subunit B
VEYNTEHGITPESIKKDIRNTLSSVYEQADYGDLTPQAIGFRDNDQALLHDPKALQKEIKRLDARMHKAAADLEFEEAARLRDEIRRLEALDLQVR